MTTGDLIFSVLQGAVGVFLIIVASVSLIRARKMQPTDDDASRSTRVTPRMFYWLLLVSGVLSTLSAGFRLLG